ncbi:hypothetical protein [Ruminococcus flavefaciens]|uniref:hypothetical protein n=1 Tax=Ruminococcus flavefaciens TaxID=1265 RepID=UPI0026EF1446|nr:hypothetical protein [Ruminococcus flavefaciens]
MKVYPLIYSRTKFCDYVSGFLVRPVDLDYSVALKYVSDAINDTIKHAGGLRHAVFSVGEYIIYGGTACITPHLISRILLEKKIDKLDIDYNDFKVDKADRPITFFIGFGVKRSSIENAKQIPNIDLYDTYKIYLRYLEKQWNSSTAETEIINADEGIDIDFTEWSSTFKPNIVEFKDVSLLKNYDEDSYKEIINYYFQQIVNNPTTDNSFLSCVLPEMIYEGLYFKNVSIYGITIEEFFQSNNKLSTDNNANQLNTDYEKPQIYNSVEEYTNGTPKTSSMQQPRRPVSNSPTIYHNIDQYTQNSQYEGKKSKPTSRIVLIIAITLLVGLILIIAIKINTNSPLICQTTFQGNITEGLYTDENLLKLQNSSEMP